MPNGTDGGRWVEGKDRLVAESDGPIPWHVEGHLTADGGCRWLLDSPVVRKLKGWSTTGDGWWQRRTHNGAETAGLVSEISGWP